MIAKKDISVRLMPKAETLGAFDEMRAGINLTVSLPLAPGWKSHTGLEEDAKKRVVKEVKHRIYGELIPKLHELRDEAKRASVMYENAQRIDALFADIFILIES